MAHEASGHLAGTQVNLLQAIDSASFCLPRSSRATIRQEEVTPFFRVLARTASGGMTINDTVLHVAQDRLPFGGVGPSGMGRYQGVEGFRAVSKYARCCTPAGSIPLP